MFMQKFSNFLNGHIMRDFPSKFICKFIEQWNKTVDLPLIETFVQNFSM